MTEGSWQKGSLSFCHVKIHKKFSPDVTSQYWASSIPELFKIIFHHKVPHLCYSVIAAEVPLLGFLPRPVLPTTSRMVWCDHRTTACPAWLCNRCFHRWVNFKGRKSSHFLVVTEIISVRTHITFYKVQVNSSSKMKHMHTKLTGAEHLPQLREEHSKDVTEGWCQSYTGHVVMGSISAIFDIFDTPFQCLALTLIRSHMLLIVFIWCPVLLTKTFRNCSRNVFMIQARQHVLVRIGVAVIKTEEKAEFLIWALRFRSGHHDKGTDWAEPLSA